MSGNWFDSAGILWLIAAAVLGIAELLIPGLFLVFVAIAAGIVGLATLALPGLPLALQVGAFAAWSVVAVLVGRRWYRDYPVATSDPLLNNRAARMIGQTVTVDQAIAGGQGRVRIGDGSWPAIGADAQPGARVRIVAVEGGAVRVEPVDQPRDITASRA